MIQSIARVARIALLLVTPLVAPNAVMAETLLIERDVTVDAMVSDRFTLSDAANQPRGALPQPGPSGTLGLTSLADFFSFAWPPGLPGGSYGERGRVISSRAGARRVARTA